MIVTKAYAAIWIKLILNTQYNSPRKRISETRARRVEKIAKFHIMPDARRRQVPNALRVRWVRLVYVRCTSLYVARNRRAFRARFDKDKHINK